MTKLRAISCHSGLASPSVIGSPVARAALSRCAVAAGPVGRSLQPPSATTPSSNTTVEDIFTGPPHGFPPYGRGTSFGIRSQFEADPSRDRDGTLTPAGHHPPPPDL